MQAAISSASGSARSDRSGIFTSRITKRSPATTRPLDSGVLPSYRGVTMNSDDVIRKDVIQQIMCHGTIDIPATEKALRHRVRCLFSSRIGAARDACGGRPHRGRSRRIDLTPRGRLLMRNVAMAFDAYGPRARAQRPLMSRAI
jgi:oxygen-independent coproporphyrinogen III oxidase